MWLQTTTGFFSIVEKPGDRAERMLTVRARVAEDLDMLRSKFIPSLTPTQVGQGTDYPFRARAPKSDVAAGLMELALSVDYPNFKDAVLSAQGSARAANYGQVWATLAELETNVQRRAEPIGAVAEWEGVIGALWDIVDGGVAYDRPVGAAASEFLYREQLDHVLEDPDLSQVNRGLRQAVGPLLTHDTKAVDAARWIVQDWGRIRGGGDPTEAWLLSLDDFGDEAVWRFVGDQGRDRISSWSKIIAFARPECFAIYDARVAIGLNAALSQIGDPRRFYVPPTQVTAVHAARADFSPKRGNAYGYRQYIALLRTVVQHGLSLDMLAAEMTVFANAPRLLAE